MNIPIEQIRDDFDFYYAGLEKPLKTVKELIEDIAKNGKETANSSQDRG